ncbi:MAG: Spo11/DNA topoisomerase VI subunit A, partial [Linnemannia gamsii]
IHENLSKDIISSKRDLFYRDVLAFGGQPAVDSIVEDLACTLEVPRECLNVVAGSRSVVFGSVRMLYDKDDPLDSRCSQTSYNTLVTIPVRFADIVEIEMHPRTRFVLVIEKEATFGNLISLGFCETHGPCILLTSKGFPDQVARRLLKVISDMVQEGVFVKKLRRSDTTTPRSSPISVRVSRPLQIPLLALVDCDPQGIEIYLAYRCGSIASAYHNANLAVPGLKCLGQVPSDWDVFLNGPRFLEAFIPLTERDRRKLERILTGHPYIRQHVRWKEQILRMLELNGKTELQ